MIVDTDDPAAHEALLTDAATKLGRMHWYLLHALEAFEARTWSRNPQSPDTNERFITYRPKLTAFGRSAGLDPIKWWVAQGESNLAELDLRTREAYDAAQPLLKAAELLLDISALPDSYDGIIERLRAFADTHEPKVASLIRYTEWLHERDTFAPAILFSHDVWGSTRRSDRMIDLQGLPNTNKDLIAQLTLIVFGFRDWMMFTVDHVRLEVMGEMFDAMGEDAPASVPEDRVLAQTGYECFDAFKTYLHEIRDSLRAIDSAIHRQYAANDIIYSESFWRAFIAKARAKTRTEDQLWHFKEALPFWDIGSKSARGRGKLKFCEQIAAFANTSGGVLVVGVRDADRVVVGVPELEDKRKFTREVLDHQFSDSDFVVLQQVVVNDDCEAEQTCLVVIIRQTADPLVMNSGKGPYCAVRKETGLDRVPPTEVREAKQALRVSNHRFLADLKTWVES